jgi:N utilization substance protein A
LSTYTTTRKDVVEEVFDDRDEVDLSTALVKNPAYEIGDIYEVYKFFK